LFLNLFFWLFVMVDINKRKEKCLEIILENPPESAKNEKGEFSQWSLEACSAIDKEEPVITEYLSWYNLDKKFYWRSLSCLKILQDKKELDSRFSDEDLSEITRIMVNQTMEGEAVASSVPLYRDVWEKLGEEDSPLAEFVTEEDKKIAVNYGFWDCLSKIKDRRMKTGAQREFGQIRGYKDFFKYFDFKQGVEEARKMSDDLTLGTAYDFNSYLSWFFIQQEEIYCELDKKEADKTAAKLVAPILEIITGHYEDFNGEGNLRKMIDMFVSQDIALTKPIQRVLGEAFEYELGLAYEDDDYCSRVLKICESNLSDENKEQHARAVWEEQEDIDFFTFDKEIRKYIPNQRYQEYAQNLKEKIQAKKRFDFDLFARWIDLNENSGITKQARGILKNKMLETYVSQKQRPSGKTIDSLSHLALDSFYIEKLGSHYERGSLLGSIFPDMILKGMFSEANDFIISYSDRPYKQKKLFSEAFEDYVKLHGKIKFPKNMLGEKALYPKYNLLKDSVLKNPDSFVIFTPRQL